MANFIIATNNPELYPAHEMFECCLVGRSNVGKSTLINALASNNIAYVSKTPGRTRTINFYDFQVFFLVDLPGYGYAKVNHQKQNELVEIVEYYLYYRSQLMSVVHICDINVITELDISMKNYLLTKFDNYLLCLNKMDKLSYSQQQKKLNEISKIMNLAKEKIILISAKKKSNVQQIFQTIRNWTKK